MCSRHDLEGRGVGQRIFDEAPTSVITLCLPLFLVLVDIRRGLDS